MPSQSLRLLETSIAELRALQRANPTPLGSALKRPEVTRAIGRASVVLLSSHYERYLRNLNQEAVESLLEERAPVDRLPGLFRLLHARLPVDQIVETSWDRRDEKLHSLISESGPLWVTGARLEHFDHTRLLDWMSSPKCKSVERLFRIWGDGDIFGSVTRLPTSRGSLYLRLTELVDKRNLIAHGDLTVEATYLDVVQYIAVVRKFAASADKRMARLVQAITGAVRPW